MPACSMHSPLSKGEGGFGAQTEPPVQPVVTVVSPLHATPSSLHDVGVTVGVPPLAVQLCAPVTVAAGTVTETLQGALPAVQFAPPLTPHLSSPPGNSVLPVQEPFQLLLLSVYVPEQ
jgi:hypothetical protein